LKGLFSCCSRDVAHDSDVLKVEQAKKAADVLKAEQAKKDAQDKKDLGEVVNKPQGDG